MLLLFCRDPKPIWGQQCALDQGGPFSRSLTANLLNCKKHLPHLSPLFLQELYIWPIFHHLIIYGLWSTWVIVWILNCLRYGNASYVDERHRHRYEVNPDMVPEFEKAGLSFVGRDESGKRMEVRLPTFFMKINHVLVSCIWFVTCRLSNYQLIGFSLVYNFTLNSSQGLASHLRFS